MYENAQEIFDYLPISRSKPEADYIDHLWNAFVALDNTENSARPFIIMPFHLLFILALQFKVLRIAREQKGDYDLAFTMESPRDDRRAVLNPGSAFDLALLNESKLIDLLKIVGMSSERVREIKSLVRNRNDNLAHAKGGIEPDPNERVDQYLAALKELQPFFVSHNNRLAEQWLSEITDEDDLKDYVDACLPDSQLCPADFKAGMLSVFSLDEDVLLEEWQAAVARVIASGAESGLLWLKYLAQNHPDSSKRLNVIQNLGESGRLEADCAKGAIP